MKLSKYFTSEEFEASQTASRFGIDNSIPRELFDNAIFLAEKMDLIREFLGNPIIVTSGYRSKKLNNAILGSAKNSSHMSALACDFYCPKYGSVLDVCNAIVDMKNRGLIEFDQLIHEYGGWVHVGFQKPFRNQLLTVDKTGWRDGILEIRK